MVKDIIPTLHVRIRGAVEIRMFIICSLYLLYIWFICGLYIYVVDWLHHVTHPRHLTCVKSLPKKQRQPKAGMTVGLVSHAEWLVNGWVILSVAFLIEEYLNHSLCIRDVSHMGMDQYLLIPFLMG